jgi:hypothetical protein
VSTERLEVEKLNPPTWGGGPQFREALERIIQIVIEGLRHGHFRCSVSSVIGKANRRELVIEAGKSHKFNVPEEELPR